MSSGLILKNIQTKAKVSSCKITSVDHLSAEMENHLQAISDMRVVAYLNHKVLIGKVIEGKFIFNNKEQLQVNQLQRLRIFDKDEELLLWKGKEENFKMRLRSDLEGIEADVIEAEQVLWGTKAYSQNKSGWTKITEKRGTELILPLENLELDEYDKRVRIITRNYIEYNKYGQAGYVDSRFVEFVVGGE